MFGKSWRNHLSNKALAAGLGNCPQCHKLNVMHAEKQACSRCLTVFSTRKPKSLEYTLAWTIAALVMFIPANLYPMMVFYTLGKPDASTILEGSPFLFKWVCFLSPLLSLLRVLLCL